jgi:uncharacterized membrane protein YraQ (UPF0718 family)
MTKEKSYGPWYFLGIVILIYLVLLFIQPENILSSLNKTLTILKTIIPLFIIVIILMTITNYFIKPKWLIKHLGKDSGIKGWIVSIIGGMLSTGPVYLWLPLLNDLKKQGVRNAFLATFLYNRAIKLALLPVLIGYLGLLYTAVLTVFMIVASVLQGIITEKLIEVKI